MSAKKVFISYSHDSPEHKERVLELAWALRDNGIDVEIDQFHNEEIVDWHRWTNEQTDREHSEFVVCVCTAEYRRRVAGKVPPEKGKGAYWEGSLLEGDLYDAKGNVRLIPILFDDEPEGSLLGFLRGWTHCRMRKFELSDAGYELLIRILTRQVKVEKNPLGTVPVLPTQRAPTGPPQLAQTDFKADISRLSEAKAGIGELETAAGNQPSSPPGDSTVPSVVSQSPTHTELPAADRGGASLESEISSKQLSEDKMSKESGPKPPGVSWSNYLRNAITALFVVGFALAMGYGAVFGPKISMVVQDLDWEPRSPKPGETVKFTAKFASTYTVRQFAGAYWPRLSEVEGKRSAQTFTETWSIAGAEFKKDRVEVLESGRVTTSQIEKVFDQPGSYRVKFSLSVQRDDHLNEIIRTIWVGDN